MARHFRVKHRRRHHNPLSYRRRRHHRNPLGISKDVLTLSLWGAAGAVAARAVPQVVMSGSNTGVMGYGLNIGTTIVASMLAGSFAGPAAGTGVMVGGLIATGLRIVSDNFGSTISWLKGDPSFQLGSYVESPFAVPTKSDAYGRTNTFPYAQLMPAPPAAAGVHGLGYHRFRGRYAGNYGQ